VTVRYSHILSILPAVALFESLNISILFIFYISCIIISGAYNDSIYPAYALSAALIYSYLIFYVPALCFARNYPILGVKAILQSSRILMIIGILLQISGFTERMGALFYEPAYMSIFMAAYCSLCFTESKLVKPIDYILLIIFLYLSKSAAFILVLLGVAVYLIFINKKKIIKLIFIFYILLTLYYVSIERSNLNFNIVEAALSIDVENILELSRQRTGERFDFLILSLNETIKSPIFGIGARTFQDMHNGIPPANIFFQVILEGGILGLLICLVAIKNYFKNVSMLERYRNFIVCTSIALLFALQIESTYMRAYLWVFFGIFSGIIMNHKKINEETSS